MKAASGLSLKQERFCNEYLKDLNGTQAAIRAGYSKRSANEQAARLLAKDSISQRVMELMHNRDQRLCMEADETLRRISDIARSDVSMIFDELGYLLPIKDMPAAARAAISSIQVYEQLDEKKKVSITRKIKLWDKVRALELVARHHGLFIDRKEVTGKIEHLHQWLKELPDDQLRRAAGYEPLKVKIGDNGDSATLH